jgi:hypothetical protein
MSLSVMGTESNFFEGGWKEKKCTDSAFNVNSSPNVTRHAEVACMEVTRNKKCTQRFY